MIIKSFVLRASILVASLGTVFPVLADVGVGARPLAPKARAMVE